MGALYCKYAASTAGPGEESEQVSTIIEIPNGTPCGRRRTKSFFGGGRGVGPNDFASRNRANHELVTLGSVTGRVRPQQRPCLVGSGKVKDLLPVGNESVLSVSQKIEFDAMNNESDSISFYENAPSDSGWKHADTARDEGGRPPSAAGRVNQAESEDTEHIRRGGSQDAQAQRPHKCVTHPNSHVEQRSGQDRHQDEILGAVAIENLLSSNLDAVILEGRVMRCGASRNPSQAIQRWGQITKRCFCYFTDRLANIKGEAKPLVSIPLSDILSVKKMPPPIKKGGRYACFEIDVNCGKEDEEEKKSDTGGMDHGRRNTISDVAKWDSQVSAGNGYDFPATQLATPVASKKPSAKTMLSGIKDIKRKPKEMFALENEEERDKWVAVLDWLIRMQRSV